MSTNETLAQQLARCVTLFRDPGAKEAQKVEFRVLLALLKNAAISIRPVGGGVEVNGAPSAGADVTALAQRLELHGIADISVPAAPPPAQLFELLRALGDQPTSDDVVTRLTAVGVDRIRVTLAHAAPGGRSTPPASPVAEAEASVDGTPALGTEGILRGEPWRDTASVPMHGVPLVSHDPPPPPAADALPVASTGSPVPPPVSPASPAPPSRARASASPHAPTPPGAPPEGVRAREGPEPEGPGAAEEIPPALAPPAPEPVSAHPTPAAPAAARPTPPPRSGSGAFTLPPAIVQLLTELERHPAAPDVGDVLAALVQHTETAIKQRRPDQLLGVITGITRVEEGLSEASGARRQYAIALRRVYTKSALDTLVRLLSEPIYRSDAITALRRGGAGAVEVLMELLVAAPTIGERRSAFDALRHMSEGRDQLIHALEHQEWFVVRNVAELIGELGIEEAVPGLVRHLDHEDVRVRKAVAMALAKIGTRRVVEPLRRALHDPSSEVRVQVALGIGGPRSTALAMPCVVALDEEKDEVVRRELILALGRIGTPDAVQALIKWAQPAGRFFGRKPTALRLAAVEGLRLAATPAAVGTLEGLAQDGDRQTQEAARGALADLKRKPGARR